MTSNSALTQAQIIDWAEQHERARVAAQAIDPPSSLHPEMTFKDAYRIQQAWVDLQIANGAEVLGHKIGLTSRAMQQAMQIDTPDSGYLLDYMFYESGVELNVSNYVDPMLEVELAFVLSEDLSGVDLTIDDVLKSTEWVVPALELIDARSWRKHPKTGRTRLIVDTIADNAADAAIILGDRRFPPDAIDLRWVSAICSRNGTVEETGVSAGVMDHPAAGIAWLAKRYAQELDSGLEKGQTILSGSFTRPLRCRAGDEFVIEYQGPGPASVVDLGSINCGFRESAGRGSEIS